MRPKEVRREDALRPSPYLGYDRHSVALHCMSRGAFDIAESELRRIVWLNPYEPQFAHDLAWCLYRQQRYQEAKEWGRKALEQRPDDQRFGRTLALIARHAEMPHTKPAAPGAPDHHEVPPP
jgi:tetratricopeptide (TPR) repeat protein